MGIKGFTKVFESSGEIKYKQLKGKHIAIDAMVEIYRACLGMKNINALTDSKGNPTIHINSILLGVILKLKEAGAKQYWVFDYDSSKDSNAEYHNPLKVMELQKRKAKANAAKERIKELENQLSQSPEKDELFSDSESEDEKKDDLIKKPCELPTKDKIQSDIHKNEKIAFRMKEFYINDVKLMLNFLDIPWVEAPKKFESEHFASLLTEPHNCGINGQIMDYVLSTDADALLFGASKLIKRDIRKKKLFEYNLKKILKDKDISMDELIKIGVILGCDFAPKSKGIGPKTVLKKLDNIELSKEQNDAIKVFKLKLTDSECKKIKWNNENLLPFSDSKKIEQLLDWLEFEKSYNRKRIEKSLNKALNIKK